MARDSLFLLLLLQLVAFYKGAFSRSDLCSDCLLTDSAELDFFRMYTTIAKQKELLSMPLNEAPRIGTSDKNEPSYEFSGSHWLRDEGSKQLNSVVCGMCSRHEVTFHASLLFLNDDVGGPLIHLSHDLSPVFSMEVNSKGNVLSVYYLHRNMLIVEKFTVEMNIGTWYKVALHFSGNSLKLFVDCKLTDSRVIKIPDYCINKDVNVFAQVGKNAEGTSYRGSLQSVRIFSGSNPLVKQCPDIDNEDVDCPVCGSLLTVLKKLKKAEDTVLQLRNKIDSGCDPVEPPKTCEIESVIYDNGEFAKTRDGEICYCENGNTRCVDPTTLQPPPEPSQVVASTTVPAATSLPLESPMTTENTVYCGEVTVGSQKITLALGEKDYTKVNDECIVHECISNTFLGALNRKTEHNCNNQNEDSCASLSSKDAQNVAICCGTCPACDFATCPSNSECINVPPNFECRCSKGFTPSASSQCQDIDECLLSKSEGGHDCPADSTCVNTEGSFTCDCPPFYEISMIGGEKRCVDIDECADNTHSCPTDTLCLNTLNGYNCTCMDGFKLGDEKCIPVCDPPCEYGECIAPSTCECIEGFTGDTCSEDVDECLSGDRCPDPDGEENVTRCVNTFGGFFCTCITGLQRKHKDDGTAICKSINECDTGLHLCPKESTCLNTALGYHCQCASGVCDGKCQLDGGRTLDNGEKETKGCDICTCMNGHYTCDRIPCNCSDNSKMTTHCCPQCSRKDYCFGSNGLTLKVGEHHYLSDESCSLVSCEEDVKGGSPVLKQSTADCPTLQCPLGKQYTPTGTCCPVCTLPNCTSSIYGQTRSFETNGSCEKCTCDADEWSCTSSVCTSSCPSLNGCSVKHITSLSEEDCPVCVTTSHSEQYCTTSISS